MTVGQAFAKQALVLVASNPKLGGAILRGGKGTGKSTLARSLTRLLPAQIQRIKGSVYNIDPKSNEVDTLLRQELANRNVKLTDLDTEVTDMPFVTVPLNCQEDSLLGNVDIEKSLTRGEAVFEPGLLARAHRGVLYVDDINLLDDGLLSVLLDIISNGWVTVEREGISIEYPCRPRLFLASYNPEEGELREHFTDRIDLSIPLASDNLTVQERVAVVLNVEGFQDKTIDLNNANREDGEFRDAIKTAEILLPRIQIDLEQILYLCKEATLADCEGQRAEIFAAEIAKTSAAIAGRSSVNARDLELGVLFAIVPRARAELGGTESRIHEEDSRSTHADSPLTRIPPPPLQDVQIEEKESEQEDANVEENNSAESDEEQKLDEITIPESFLFRTEATVIDAKVLDFFRKARKGRGGRRSKIVSLLRGHFVKAIFPIADWKRARIAIGATLRAAAPHQAFRRRISGDKRVSVKVDDFRIQRLVRKSGSLVIFVVDSSGSMALNRMSAAKGAAMSLLQEAYKSRDKISLISFHDTQAEVLVPPTKSLALTCSRLEGIPCGGASPMAHALTTAIRMGTNSLRVKKDVGHVLIVLVTDGRANIPLSISESKVGTVKPSQNRKFLREEIMAIAKTLRSTHKLDLVVVDTEDKYVGTGLAEDLARLALGKYYHVEGTDEASLAQIARHEALAHRH